MGATCSSHLIHLYMSIPTLPVEESSLRPLSRKFLCLSVPSCHACPTFPLRYPFPKHPQFVLFPQGSSFPLFKPGFLLLSRNRFPGVQTILFTGALGLVYCFHGNLYTSFAYKTLRIVSVIQVSRT